jgi:hypothetical protein
MRFRKALNSLDSCLPLDLSMAIATVFLRLDGARHPEV